MGIDSISSGATHINQVTGIAEEAPPPQTASAGGAGNVVSQFSDTAQSVMSGGIGDIFGAIGSLFGGGKSSSSNGFDLGSIIGAIFDNPIFKLFEGLFGGGKKPDAVAAPPPQSQPLAQDAEGSLFGARAGASSEEASSADFDADAAVGNGLPLSAIDDIDNTSSVPVSKLPELENDK